MSALLELRNVSKSFAGVRAVNGVSLKLQPGEIVGLIGPNGAGKTTLVNLITGVFPPSEGSIVFDGRIMSKLPPHQIAWAGIARTFQVVQPFPDLSVLDNVATGALFCREGQTIDTARAIALECLEFTGLAGIAHNLGSTLSLANRKRLELAKSLATSPRLLLLDEVNAGLNPTEIENALKVIRSIADRGITIILIEHLMKVVTRSCSRVVVLHNGELISDGATEAVMHDERVVEAYLGPKYAARFKLEAAQ
jgi:branched-chain amino acid transport system ATP-binding protein